MVEYQNIKKIHLEISSRCNSACPDCPRNLRGVDIDGLFVERDMTLEDVQTLFPSTFIKQLEIININGNYGDFVTARDGLKIVQYLSESNPDLKITISTNGSAQPKIWSKLALIPNIEITFRLDGLVDTHSIYRQDTDFDTIISNAKSFINAGGYAIWAMILFDHNRHQVEEAKQLSKELGFKEFILVDAGRNNMVVFDRQKRFKGVIGHLTEIVTDWDILYNNFKGAQENNHQLHQQYYASAPKKHIDCRVKKQGEIYVQANGQVYPCCWLGFSPDTNCVREGNDQVRAVSQGNNALEVGLEQAIKWFQHVEHSWNRPSVKEGQFMICNQTCGVTPTE